MPAGVPGKYCVATIDGFRVTAIGSIPEGQARKAVWNTYISVDNVDAMATRIKQAGGTITQPPMDVPNDAGRLVAFTDTSGAPLHAWQPNKHIGAQLVNEPGTWNWSDLNTRDMAAAKSFYNSVFGWQTMPVDFGMGEAYMVRMPGYGDFLEQMNPGVRKGHQDAGAPEGFTDAICWLQPLTDETAQPHWSITFSTDDADAIAERATKLGGTVVVPPFDVPYARITVMTDPQGATFTASKFIPPS
jgi:predicted enzyme related to lactoylglutathione lyase